MKPIKNFKTIALGLILALFISCGSGNYKGSASDTTGNNGATNGTGKIAR